MMRTRGYRLTNLIALLCIFIPNPSLGWLCRPLISVENCRHVDNTCNNGAVFFMPSAAAEYLSHMNRDDPEETPIVHTDTDKAEEASPGGPAALQRGSSIVWRGHPTPKKYSSGNPPPPLPAVVSNGKVALHIVKMEKAFDDAALQEPKKLERSEPLGTEFVMKERKSWTNLDPDLKDNKRNDMHA